MISMNVEDYNLAVMVPDEPSVAVTYTLTVGYPAAPLSETGVSVIILDCSPIIPPNPFVTLSIGESLSVNSDKIYNQDDLLVYKDICVNYLFTSTSDNNLVDPITLNADTYTFSIPQISSDQPIGDY